MALGGLHKDSILNLAALLEDESNHRIATGLTQDNNLDDTKNPSDEINKNESNTNFVDVSSRRVYVSKDREDETATTTDMSDNPPPNPYYTGFDLEYDDSSYSYDPYAPIVVTRDRKGFDFFSCLFPFCIPEKEEEESAQVNASQAKLDGKVTSDKITSTVPKPDRATDQGNLVQSNLLGVASPLLNKTVQQTSSRDEEDTKKFGAPLTDTERRAVIARLRLLSGHDEEEKKESSYIPSTEEESKGQKEEENNVASPISMNRENEEASKSSVKSEQKVKSILKKTSKSMDTKSEDPEAAHRRSLFSGVAYESKFEKKKRDNSQRKLHFAPMAKVVVIPGRHHLADSLRREIWWSRRDYDDFKKTGRMISRAILEGGSSIWLSSKSGFKYSELDGDTSYGNKWWCKFGHSRRGLEHIASIEEGRHRQQNVSNAIKTTIGEQTRQRIYKTKDEERLSKVASRYTNFARDLALAAGKADADAIRTNFRASNRVHYKLLPLAKAYNEENVRALDEFTVRRVPPTQNKEIKSDIRDTSALTKEKQMMSITDQHLINDKEISKKAAGFGTSENNAIGFIEKSFTVKSHA